MSLSADDRARPILVVGAGLAGLSAALHLAERGLPVLILEADPDFAGGRVAAKAEIDVNGWRFRLEHGVHAIWSPYRNLQAMLVRHALRPVWVPTQEEVWLYKRRGRVRQAAIGSAIRQSWIPAPFHYLNLFFRPSFLSLLDWRDWLSLFNVWYGLMLAVAIDPLREGQPLEGQWLSALVDGWPPSLRALFIGLARNGLAARPEEIPLAGFIAFLRFYTLLRRDAWAFSYLPADGGTSLVDPLAGRLQALGGQIELGRRVTRLEPDGDGWRVHWQAAASAEAGSEQAAQVILAADAPNTQAILEASPSLNAAGLYWPRGLPSAIARLWFDRTPRPGAEAGVFSGEFTGHNFFWLHRIQDPYVRWHRATGGSAIEVHLYGPPELLAAPDAILQAHLLNDVQSAFPELGGRILQQHFQRNPPTHTLLSLGPPERHLGIETRWPGIYCCGDWVRHPSPAFFLERACVTGIEAANAVLRARQLPPWPLLGYLPPEPPAAWIEKRMRGVRQALRPK
jgi:carotenoid phi-ring synthase / carotenoid chi-ring synthase